MNLIPTYILFFLLLLHERTQAQEMVIYGLHVYGISASQTITFTSLSDSYRFSEHPDSLAVPNEYLGKQNIAGAQYFKLPVAYRQRFLTNTNISESDKVFIYDFSLDSLVAFPVKNLDLIALLSPYFSSNNGPVTQYEYMIAFKFDEGLLQGFGQSYAPVMIYIGKQNPFITGKIKPLVWEKTDPALFPSTAGNKEDSALLKLHEPGETYFYQSGNISYYIQDLMLNDHLNGRHLLVKESGSKAVLCDKVFYETEGTSLTPLNNIDPNHNNPIFQWTGLLFKNKPPVIFGFLIYSFGCPKITFLNPSEPDIYIRCDNRH